MDLKVILHADTLLWIIEIYFLRKYVADEGNTEGKVKWWNYSCQAKSIYNDDNTFAHK